jgi:hypothetical protein
MSDVVQSDGVSAWALDDGSLVARFAATTGGARAPSTGMWGAAWTDLIQKVCIAVLTALLYLHVPYSHAESRQRSRSRPHVRHTVRIH